MDNTSRELVPVPEGDEFSELQKIRSEEYNASLRNLVTGRTPKEDFPGGVIPQRTISSKAPPVDYVPGWWFIKQLNSLFGHFWDFKIINQGIGQEQVWVLGELTVKDPKTGLTVTKSAFGGSKIKSKENPGIDIGDDLKSAATDSLKKAATLLGFAADVYGRREMLEQVNPLKSQLTVLYKIGKDKGMDAGQVDDLSVKEYGDTPDKLESIKVLGLISKLRSKS